MALTVVASRVKEKLGLTAATWDTAIGNLIDEMVPAISYGIEDAHLADVSNAGLQALLNLGALEMVCGEFAAQLAREPGAAEEVWIGDIHLRPPGQPLDDPTGLAAQGASRLRPFLKPDPAQRRATGVISAPLEEPEA